MTTSKKSDEEAKRLQQQIQEDDDQDSKPAEKPLKLDTSFGDAVRRMARAKPIKDQSQD